MLPALSGVLSLHRALGLGSDRIESSSDLNWRREYWVEKEGCGEDILAATELYGIYIYDDLCTSILPWISHQFALLFRW